MQRAIFSRGAPLHRFRSNSKVAFVRCLSSTIAHHSSTSRAQSLSRVGRRFGLVTLAHEPFASDPPWNTSIPPSPESAVLDGAVTRSCFNWSELFQPGARPVCVVDVRSPSEYQFDHIPGAVSHAVLDDEQRSCVGKLYSEGETLKARIRGASMICNNIGRLLSEFESGLSSAQTSERINLAHNGDIAPGFLIYCARGGHRSASLATILSEIGWPGPVYVLVGGFQSWRRLLLRQLDAWPRWRIPGPFWVISGFTGSGKSLILDELAGSGETVLDLEKLAHHKGSMFGSGDLQISQRQFESRIHSIFTQEATSKLIMPSTTVWLECESRSVGPSCHISESLWKRLRSTDPQVRTHRVWIDISEDARVDWILEDYSEYTLDPAKLHIVLSKMLKYQPANRVNKWLYWADHGDFRSLVTGFLRHHYDPLYRSSRQVMLTEAYKNGLLHRIPLSHVDRSNIRKTVLPLLLELSSIRSTEQSILHRDQLTFRSRLDKPWSEPKEASG